MQFLLDNILATIIAGTVFLMIVALTVRGYETSLNATNHYSLKRQELNFIEVLKQDLSGVKKVYTAIENPVDQEFSFRTRINPGSDTATAVIKYKRVWTQERNGVDFYQIQRIVDDAPSGASMLTITEWQVEARNDAGNIVADSALGTAQQIYIRFEAAAPYKDDDILSLSRWEATFRPPLLRPGTAML